MNDIELEYVISILFYHNLLLFCSENVLQFDILPSFPEKLSRLPVTLSIYVRRCPLFILSTLDSKCSRKNFCGYESIHKFFQHETKAMYGINILSQVHNKRLNVQYCQNISNEQKLFNVGYIHRLKKFVDRQNSEY